MERKELRRSNTDKMIAGVCGGLAEYFNISSALARLIFVVLGLALGCGLLLYVIAAVVIPRSDIY
ncbi:MAG: PspC domain-containing protein [Clostridiales bacterium]|nr:PspC domain-containing protein [Clostridiales bacterium]